MTSKTLKKEFCEKIQKTILSHFDDFETLKNEINHYFNNFSWRYGKTMVEYGCFDCYYSQCAESLAEWFNMSVDDVWAYYKEDSEQLWKAYMHFICRELEQIRINKRVYIN